MKRPAFLELRAADGSMIYFRKEHVNVVSVPSTFDPDPNKQGMVFIGPTIVNIPRETAKSLIETLILEDREISILQ